MILPRASCRFVNLNDQGESSLLDIAYFHYAQPYRNWKSAAAAELFLLPPKRL